jgi:hypothetical protein
MIPIEVVNCNIYEISLSRALTKNAPWENF